jgi:hypothetical protein
VRGAAYYGVGTSNWTNLATATTPRAPQPIQPGSSYPPPDMPIQCDETIRGHVLCTLLALVLRQELQDGLSRDGHKFK